VSQERRLATLRAFDSVTIPPGIIKRHARRNSVQARRPGDGSAGALVRARWWQAMQAWMCGGPVHAGGSRCPAPRQEAAAGGVGEGWEAGMPRGALLGHDAWCRIVRAGAPMADRVLCIEDGNAPGGAQIKGGPTGGVDINAGWRAAGPQEGKHWLAGSCPSCSAPSSAAGRHTCFRSAKGGGGGTAVSAGLPRRASVRRARRAPPCPQGGAAGPRPHRSALARACFL
jgi:hypothetical protein